MLCSCIGVFELTDWLRGEGIPGLAGNDFRDRFAETSNEELEPSDLLLETRTSSFSWSRGTSPPKFPPGAGVERSLTTTQLPGLFVDTVLISPKTALGIS